jgi:hypothetical protein
MQLALMHESLTDALRECVSALGGPKKVGAAMRPELSVDQAGVWVRDRLNPDRRELFAPEQLVWLLREARSVGCHAAMTYFARECGYADPVPLEPQDERAKVMREFVEAQRQMQVLAARMERAGLLKGAP